MSSTEPINNSTTTVHQQQPPALQRHDSTGSSSNNNNKNNNNNNNNNVDARFSCNICFDSVVEPVVTQCGHLYCWPCLYRWLEPGMYPEERASLGLTISMSMSMGGNSLSFDNTRRVCPVCKSPCSLPSLVPIYVRSTNEPSPVNRSNHSNQTIRGLRSDNGSTERRQETTQTVHPSMEESREEQQQEQQQQSSSSTTAGQQQQQQQQQQQPPLEDSIHDANLGLRQRHSRAVDATATTSLSTSNDSNQVPSRPAASSPQHPTNRHNTPSRNNQQHSTVNHNNWISMSPNVRHGSLTHGILMSFHQAAMHVQNENNANNSDSSQGQRTIPSLHSIRDGSYEGNFQQQQQQPIDVNSETTQYLSRLLIMLTSFVILCLLLL
ncbi:zinc-ring finger domain containing protein [Nitzschia inconspicua]|uniref:RING-type E3 ubiquitin transferase n=1 Tax=Nitzschia inconspicua TaxID=303405 RepID=A0A9K3Q0T6_9STRA|nr:zinc-ring finger domain containing protein [Nitzschia inconspicua]